MDSRLMNVFHEDPFEGNFTKYETETGFWNNDNDNTMSMQLTDTLNGILPIAPTDEVLLEQNEEEDEPENSKNLLIYNEFVEQQLNDHDVNVLNAQVYQVLTDSEVDLEQQRHLSALVDFDPEDDDDGQSQCSNSTFRTRTDSSSIGDYESHSSDYDDEEDEDVLARKERTLSTNTIASDADAFGLNIDAANFDLADFITKDDFNSNLNALRQKESAKVASSIKQMEQKPIVASTAVKSAPSAAVVVAKPLVISSKRRDSDDDSDSIIDVETVDVDESFWKAAIAAQTSSANAATVTDDLCYVDNVKDDPSWCPKQAKKPAIAVSNKEPKAADSPQVAAKTVANLNPAAPTAAATTTKSKSTHNVCFVPSKKQCDILKRGGKVGNNATAALAKSTKLAAKKVHEAAKKQQSTANTAITTTRTGLGLGGKNLALLKHERDSIAAHKEAEAEQPPTPAALPVKRKLNLEEYKQRRCGGAVAAPVPPKQLKLEPIKVAAPQAPTKVTPSPHKAAISNIINSLKCPSGPAVATDPITVAKNKVLRMLEMKRAQQLKIIDSRVSAKVPRVTKLPPLKDIVKDTYCQETEEAEKVAPPSQKLNSDYEEIIIVSASCNTDITIPPSYHQATPSSRSLLKSSVLLYNMSNQCSEGVNKNITNSLIASIQSEVVKQTSCALNTATTTAPVAEAATKDQNAQHGEDMIIMHLPKDRVRQPQVSIGTQTDLQAEFPLLTLPTTRKSRERTRRAYRKHRTSVSDDSSSSDSSCCSGASLRSRSNSNSIERLRHSDVAVAGGSSSIGGGGYSSRSTRRHRSSISSSSYSEAGKYEREQRRQRRTSYNKRRSKNQARANSSSSNSDYSDRSRSPQHRRRSRSRSMTPTRHSNSNNRRNFGDRNVSQPAVEERRIVYVGRIEQETTKEMLRRKFLPYGHIKQITIHYKENGMKYGFVTYDRAQDAFTAIDTSPRDNQINMYDISFGGRRAFCRASYADLDNAGINNYQSYVYPKTAPAAPKQEDSFEALLLKVKAKLNAGKPSVPATAEVSPQEAASATNNNHKNSNQTEQSSQI